MLKESYLDLLIKEEYLPLNEKKWNKVKIDHTVESIPAKKGFSKLKRFISSQTKGKFGVYIYTNSRKDALYIGQGNTVGRNEFGITSNCYWHIYMPFYSVILCYNKLVI